SNLDLLTGSAQFIGPHEVEVKLNDGPIRKLSTEKIFINAGGRPAIPELEGLEIIATLDSTSIMELEELPEHLLVLGGGYIGLEFGQMFRRVGSKVTIIQRANQLLGREDADVAAAVLQVMEEDDIKVLRKTKAVRVERTGARIELIVRTLDREQKLDGTHLLVAVGRKPNTEDLNLSAA